MPVCNEIPTETTIFVHTKNSEIQIFAYFFLYFYQNRTRERAKSRISANFFSGILQSFGASEKNSVDFQKNIFHAYFGCKSAIARDRDFDVKSAFYGDLRANYSNESEQWPQNVLTTQKYRQLKMFFPTVCSNLKSDNPTRLW